MSLIHHIRTLRFWLIYPLQREVYRVPKRASHLPDCKTHYVPVLPLLIGRLGPHRNILLAILVCTFRQWAYMRLSSLFRFIPLASAFTLFHLLQPLALLGMLMVVRWWPPMGQSHQCTPPCFPDHHKCVVSEGVPSLVPNPPLPCCHDLTWGPRSLPKTAPTIMLLNTTALSCRSVC